LNGVNFVYDATKKNYLEMFTDLSGNLTVNFTDNTLGTTQSVSISNNNMFNVISDRSNYKQTIEIVVPTGYTRKHLIKYWLMVLDILK
jgi:hypothetical protein